MAKVISSVSNPLVKECVKLRESSAFRKEKNSCLLSGIKLVQEAPDPMTYFVTDLSLAPQNGKEVIEVTQEVLKKITGLASPEGIAAIHPLPKQGVPQKLRRLLVLDGVSDPGNLGTLARAVLAFDWDGLFLLPSSCDPFHEKAIRSSVGAVLRIPLLQGSFEALEKLCKRENLLVLGADLKGVPFEQIDKEPPIALILGSEAHGLSLEVKKISKLITIPMGGKMESLNVSIAGAILLYSYR
jgi:TrmH family RNA methyltransferase